MNRLVLLITLLGASTAYGYEIRRSTSGDPLRWPEGNVVVELALEDAPAGTDAREAALAAERAFAVYTEALAPMRSRVRLEMRAASTNGRVTASDHVATVIWVAEGWDDDYDPDALAVTVTTYDSHSGRIDDADIVVNSAHPWSTGDDCSRAYDLQGVLAHEVGHLFGLAHDAEDKDATMYPSASVCETKKRDLGESDLEGLEFLYINAEPPPPMACQAAPGGRSEHGTAMLFLGLAALAISFRRHWIAVACVLFAMLNPAGATTIRKLELEAAGKSSGIALRGKVTSSVVKRIGDRIYTDVAIAVDECLKGACGATVVVRQLGGELDGEGVTVAGSAEMETGDEVVVLLRRRRDGTFTPVGMSQGVYRVERPGGKVETLVRDTRGLSFVGEGEGEGRVERVRFEDVKRAVSLGR